LDEVVPALAAKVGPTQIAQSLPSLLPSYFLDAVLGYSYSRKNADLELPMASCTVENHPREHICSD